MPQTITIQVGQCGNQIGSLFWNLALQEQAAYNQKGVYDHSMATFFRHCDSGSGILNLPCGNGDQPIVELKARGILVDMEEGVLNGIKNSAISDLFDPHQYVLSNSGSGNNWGQGYHQYGREYGERIMESIRVEAECCDGLQSIMMLQSTGGGTGSGLGSYISEMIRDQMPEVWRFTTCVVPSENDDVITSPYNAILSLNKITQTSDCVLPIDNQSLFDIYTKIKKHSLKDRKSESSIIDNAKLFERKQNEAYTTMNNIVANSLLSLTR